MGLSEAQYKKIIDHYDRLRTEHHREELRRLKEVCEKIPGFEDLSRGSASASGEAFRRRLSEGSQGNSTADLHDTLLKLRKEKERLLCENGFPKDYLDPILSCADCGDSPSGRRPQRVSQRSAGRHSESKDNKNEEVVR